MDLIKRIEGLYLGTSGLILPVPNKTYYPEEFKDKSRLSYFGSLFSSIEINSSFYKIPLFRTVEKWKMEVPEDFRFTFKLFKEITHARFLDYSSEVLAEFMYNISAIGDKGGCLLLQFPPSLDIKLSGKLEKLLGDIVTLKRGMNWNIALEFRNPMWFEQPTFDLAKAFEASIVIHDKGGFASAYHQTGTEIVYMRFHGPSGNYRESYENAFLYEQAGYIYEWLNEGKTVFVYFNNTLGSALNNLATLNKYIEQGNLSD
ncbi:DUF72 domain-containing protein [Pedobacter sp. AW1-32]|uniref:DUF72 domain-containing protein n=1 Tax=Pedobacter sp. AW1-32 TaxID=3383026 RepID=UPI003FED873B